MEHFSAAWQSQAASPSRSFRLKMNVLIGSQYYYPFEGGAEKQGRLLAHSLKDRGISVSYITSKLPHQPNFEDVEGIHIHRICPFSTIRPRRFRPVIYYYAVKRYLMLNGYKYDIYQAQLVADVTAPAMMTAAQKQGKAIVMRYAGINQLERLQSIFLIGKQFNQLSLSADWNVTNSPFTLAIMTNSYGLPSGKCQIINNLISQANPIDKIVARKRLQIPLETQIVLCISNINPGKNQHRLIDAWPEVLKSRSNVILIFVGTGTQERSCKTQVTRMGLSKSILFQGYKNDVDLYLSAADVFVQPSSQEGQSNAIIEAMVRGLPIAISDTPYNSCTIESGKEALAFDLSSTASISDTILRLLTDNTLAQRLGKAAQYRVFSEHDSNHITDQYLQIYKKLLA
jgi:glycosyltransferase involved in cell wall biosynthesis